MTSITGSKAATSIASAGLLAAIAQDPNFWVLFATAVIVSIMAYIYDINHGEKTSHTIMASISAFFEYVISGLAVMFVSFYGLIMWVPEAYQLPHTVWYMVSIVAAGYAMNIVDWVKTTVPTVVNKLISKWVK